MSFRTVIVAAVAVSALVAAQARAKTAKVVPVDCSKEESINAALEDKADELVIEFSGPCAEDIEIRRHDVTLRGVGDVAVLLGSGPDEPPQPTLLVSGAFRVVLEDFEVRLGDGNGIQLDASLATLRNLRLEDNALRGLAVWRGSHAEIADIAVVGNGHHGISVSSTSSLLIWGTVELLENERFGLIMAGNSQLRSHTEEPLTLIASGNVRGIQIQEGASGTLSSSGGVEVVTHDNGSGVGVIGGRFFSRHLEATNRFTGVYVQGLYSSLWVFEASISGSTFGVGGNLAGNIALDDSTVTGNSYGIWLDGGSNHIRSTMAEGNGIDLWAQFGATVDFSGENDIGSIVCDDTVLWRGEPGCNGSAALGSPPGIGLPPGELPMEGPELP